MIPAGAPAARARTARNAVVALVALLCAVFVAWHVARYSPRTAGLAGALGLAPWAAIARGLWRGERRRYVVATLLTMPYTAYGLMEVLANPGGRAYAGAVVLTSFALFVALTAFLRVSLPATAARS